MGAFFLYKKDGNFLLNDVQKVFKRKGFHEPEQFDLGDWKLWLYRKQLVNVPNYYTAEDGWAVFCCGTVVYRNLGYSNSLKRLLGDCRDSRLEQDELIGNFCLLFWDGRQLSMLTDRLNVQHVFINENRSCVSSSFLAVLAASPHPLSLNRLAIYEKLSTGYIVSPDTMVEGIFKLDDETGLRFNRSHTNVRFLAHPDQRSIRLHKKGVEDSILRQISVLKKHFLGVNALHTEFLGELGLSSGYDSRLVLACKKFLSLPFSIHTHATEGIHDADVAIVRRITYDKGLPLKEVKSRRMEKQPKERVENILKDGLYFFDGRCSHNMGAFNETYTRSYKLSVLGKHRLSWSGLGGEIYRNYYFTQRQEVDLRSWMDNKVYYTFSKDAIGDIDLYEEMHRRKVRKINKRIGGSFLNQKVKFLDLRLYYSEIRMPDCDGNNNNAHNQLAFFHTPFFDPFIIYEGINATPFIGCDGSYQAKLIKRLDPKLATYSSHYGHSFDNVPARYIFKCWTRGKIPDRLLYLRARMIIGKKSRVFIPRFMSFVNSNAMLLEIKSVLCDSVMKGRFEDAMIDYAQRPTTLFVGSFLREFQNKLKL